MKRALRSVIFICGCLFGQAVLAEDAPPINPDTGKPYATVWRVRGDVFAYPANGAKARKLREGNTIYVGDRVRADASGEAVLQARDAGMVAVRPGAEFIPEGFAAEGKPTDHQVLRLITGSLRLITGWIGQINRDKHLVITPSSTIGIRGTDHEPYVLPPEMSNATYRQGTYDKVNRGGTTLVANGQSLNIDSGKVGFIRDVKTEGKRTRALMTLLLPVLLDKVPDFYVPGQFDGELDRYSENADAVSRQKLEKKNPRALVKDSDCVPLTIAEAWIGNFDRAIARRDAQAVVALFAPQIVAKASVRSGKEGMVTLEFNREELVSSTLEAIAGLTDYTQRRVSLEASSQAACKQIDIKSVVIEQGKQSGLPYRFESLEQYQLEQLNGHWLATRMETTQR